MSVRLLKKILEEQETERRQQLGKSADSGTEDENKVANGQSESPDSSSRISLNPFDLLDQEDDDDQLQGSEPLITNESAAEDSEGKKFSIEKASLKSVPSSNNKGKKKKKKKCKGYVGPNDNKEERPFDVILEELSFEDDSSSQGSAPLAAEPSGEVHDTLLKKSMPSILQVDPKFLSAENELRRIFGTKVVNSFQKSNHTGSSKQIHGGGRRGSHSHRRTILVSPSSHWPRWDGSLYMELLETKAGHHYFSYAHSSSYGQAQRAFEAAKAIHDFNGIASVLLYHPYHLDSLITMAEYFQFSGEQQMSADAIAKCLYALECAWHPMFSPLHGNCQLKYSHDTNKPFYVTLFTHMKNMDRRGCHRSALEICKLLLSLDLDDPMGAIFCIDYFSLRAEEYAWLEQFSEEYGSDNSLWLFPNFSYSLAICRFYLEHEASSKGASVETRKATSTDLMKQALMLHPYILKKLVAKVPLKDQAWKNILKHSFFKSDQTGIPSLDHLISIYIERSYIIWRLPNLQKLLRDSALLVIDMLEQGRNGAQDWACVRKEAFSSEKNEYSHLLVSDFSDAVPTMPPENLQNFMVDPRMREAQNFEQVNNILDDAPAPRDVTNRSALAVLFESMLPWVDYGRRDGVDEDQQQDGRAQDNEN